MVSLFVATLILVVLTLVPTLELRFSIPLGILASTLRLPWLGTVEGFGLPWLYVFAVCVATNIVLGPLWYWLLGTVVRLLAARWAWFDRFYRRRVEKAQRRIKGHVDRWGWFGLALFIGVPIPGSGVYTGGLIAYALGMGHRRFFAATVLGVLIAGVLVTLFSLGVVNLVALL